MKEKTYSVKQLAELAGVSIRTLHFYDQIGLLKPEKTAENGYRYYGEKELLQLQQILFYRELDFKLGNIKLIMQKSDYDVRQALRTHGQLLKQKITRLEKLVNTVEKTLSYLKGETDMQEQEYYGGFSKEQQEKYEGEIRQKHGSAALDESKKRHKNGIRLIFPALWTAARRSLAPYAIIWKKALKAVRYRSRLKRCTSG
jgi:DNA-binding transcriptional MerR regulator